MINKIFIELIVMIVLSFLTIGSIDMLGNYKPIFIVFMGVFGFFIYEGAMLNNER